MLSQRFRETLFFWQRHLWPLFIVTAPFSLLSVAIEFYLGSPFDLVDEQVALNANALVAVLLLWPIATAALVAQLAAIQSGKPRPLIDCLQVAFKVAPLLLVASLFMAGAIGFGLMFFIVPGIWAYARLCMVPFVLILEQRTPLDAVKISFQRSSESQWALMFGLVFFTLIVFSVSSLITGLLMDGLALDKWLALAIGSLAYGLLASLVMILVFRFYLLSRTDNADSAAPTP